VHQPLPQRAATIDVAALVGGRHRRTASQDTRALLRAAASPLPPSPPRRDAHADSGGAASAEAFHAGGDEAHALLQAAPPPPQRVHAAGDGAASAGACRAATADDPELARAPEEAKEVSGERGASGMLQQALLAARGERQGLAALRRELEAREAALAERERRWASSEAPGGVPETPLERRLSVQVTSCAEPRACHES
jgi:hypothetical protein